MSELESKFPDDGRSPGRDPHCLVTSDVPGVCLRLESTRQRIALPYALLLRVELSDDETGCDLTFATHEVRIRGRWLRPVFVAVSQAEAVQVGLGDSAKFKEGDSVLGPLVTGMQIEPLDESARARR
ncbi:MAG: hypothetical protein PSU94_06890 [Lacunisphaera sp.]|nr:hypothetical protein [Lacunisphaera sp.]